jgi:hypothetical protein
MRTRIPLRLLPGFALLFLIIFLLPVILSGRESVPANVGAMIEDVARLLNMGDFPKDTAKIEIKGLLKHNEYTYELDCDLVRDPKGNLVLKQFEIDLERPKKKKFVFPETGPREKPMTSVRKAVNAILDEDLHTVKRYMPWDERERMTLEKLQKFRAKDEKRREKKGYSEFRVLLDNLPSFYSMPSGLAALKLEYRFPAEVGERKGVFEVEIELYVEEVHPANWIIKDIDVDFREQKEKEGKSAPQ